MHNPVQHQGTIKHTNRVQHTTAVQAAEFHHAHTVHLRLTAVRVHTGGVHLLKVAEVTTPAVAAEAVVRTHQEVVVPILVAAEVLFQVDPVVVVAVEVAHQVADLLLQVVVNDTISIH